MSTSRLVLLMLLLNLVTLAGGVGVSYWLLKPESAAIAGESKDKRPEKASQYEFFPVDKIIVSVRGEGREHYFVLDLALQAVASEKPKNFEQAEPIVRNSVVAYLSSLAFNELRGMSIGELQQRLEVVLFDDFASKNAAVPFEHVLVNKLLVQ